MFNRIQNSIYGSYREWKYDRDNRLVIFQSQLTYDGAGATKTGTVRLPIGNSLTINWGETGIADTVLNGNDATNVTIPSITYLTDVLHTVTYTGDLDTITSFVWNSNTDIGGNISFCKDWIALGFSLSLYATSATGDMAVLSGLVDLIQMFFQTTTIYGCLSVIENMPDLVTLYKHDHQGSNMLEYSKSITLPTGLKFIRVDDCPVGVFVQVDLERSIKDVYDQRAGLPNSGVYNCGGTTVAIGVTYQGYLDIMNSTKSWTVTYNT